MRGTVPEGEVGASGQFRGQIGTSHQQRGQFRRFSFTHAWVRSLNAWSSTLGKIHCWRSARSKIQRKLEELRFFCKLLLGSLPDEMWPRRHLFCISCFTALSRLARVSLFATGAAFTHYGSVSRLAAN